MKTFSHLHGRGISWLGATVFSLLLCLLAPSCGSIRTHAGIDHEYSYDFDDGYYRGHHKSTIKSTTKNIRSIKSIIITTTDCSLSSCTMRGEAVPRADVCGTASSLFI